MADQTLTTLSDYLGVLKRRAWVLALTVLIAGGSAYLYSAKQTPEYSASSSVALGASITAAQHLTGAQQAAAITAQAQVAHSQSMAASVISAAGADQQSSELAGIVGTTAAARANSLLAAVSVSPDTTNAVLTFTARARTAAEAVGLANLYANTFASGENQADAAALKARENALQSRITPLQDAISQQSKAGLPPNQADVALFRKLTGQLANLQGTTTGGRIPQPTSAATQVRPATTKDLAAGLGLGVVIGLTLIAFLQALDTTVRRSDAVGDHLGLPLLARIPTPPRSLRRSETLGMLIEDPNSHSEAYRQLRVNLDLANMGRHARVVMLTSAVEQEGKSTTVANLAIAFARAGRNVALVDLDLRRPEIARLLHLDGRLGFLDVVHGDATLDSALFRASVPEPGSLSVLTTGPTPPNPSDLLSHPRVPEVLRSLGERFDIVLIDSAPLLPVSDSVILSTHVDAMLVAVRASTVSRKILNELDRVLGRCPATKLGFVLTAADHDPSGYYSEYYHGHRAPAAGTPDPAHRAGSAEADPSKRVQQPEGLAG